MPVAAMLNRALLTSPTNVVLQHPVPVAMPGVGVFRQVLALVAGTMVGLGRVGVRRRMAAVARLVIPKVHIGKQVRVGEGVAARVSGS